MGNMPKTEGSKRKLAKIKQASKDMFLFFALD